MKTMLQRIIELIDSEEIRDYLLCNLNNISEQEYVKIIANAPCAIMKKIEMLKELRPSIRSNWLKDEVDEMIASATEAMDALLHFNRNNSLMVLYQMQTVEYLDEINHEYKDIVPVTSYEGILRYLQEFIRVVDPGELDPDWEKSIYWDIELYDIDEQGDAKEHYCYTCLGNGEIQYFMEYGRHIFMDFWHEDINIPLPFQAGDILEIDCRPYNLPAYCLITDMGDNADCCSVRCVYPQAGQWGEGALKHGHYFNASNQLYPYTQESDFHISPLYRAKCAKGKLLKRWSKLLELSELVKLNPRAGEQIIYKKEGLMEYEELIDILKTEVLDET